MSVNKNYYVIAGYDLTGYETNEFGDWKYTEEGEEYTCYQRKGKIQLFTDPMNDNYLYLGYILADGDDYECKTSKFTIDFIEAIHENVKRKLEILIGLGVIDPRSIPEYQVIAFEECT